MGYVGSTPPMPRPFPSNTEGPAHAPSLCVNQPVLMDSAGCAAEGPGAREAPTHLGRPGRHPLTDENRYPAVSVRLTESRLSV
jgi:hypothetical protein